MNAKSNSPLRLTVAQHQTGGPGGQREGRRAQKEGSLLSQVVTSVQLFAEDLREDGHGGDGTSMLPL